MDAPAQKFNLGRVISIVALILFAVATIWINYEVKVHVQGKRGGTVREMGNVKLGQPAPNFSVLDLSNQVVSLAGYRGKKVVLLDFWATWCGPCCMEMVDLQSLQDKFKDQPFEILGLNQNEPADQISRFIHKKQYGFHVLLDDGSVSASYGVQAIPTLVLVDKKGVIQWLKVGYDGDDAELTPKVETLLKQ